MTSTKKSSSKEHRWDREELEHKRTKAHSMLANNKPSNAALEAFRRPAFYKVNEKK